MTQWSDLPREVQVEIFKFVVADILQDHIDRVPPGVYWSPYPDYIADSDGERSPYVPGRDGVDLDYIWERGRPLYTKFRDGCEFQKKHEGLRLVSLLVVSKNFLAVDDLKEILLRYGHVSCPSPQYLSQFKDGFTSKKRQDFRVMWVRPQNIPMIDHTLPIFGPRNGDLILFRCLLYFPNLKLINLQLEQYIKVDIDPDSREHAGRWGYHTPCQDILDYAYYKNSSQWERPLNWVQDLLTSSVILQGKMELRISLHADIRYTSYEEGTLPPAAVFSSKDFSVRFHFEGQQWVVKQHRDEQYHREIVLEEGTRSSFKDIPRGIQALISARARDGMSSMNRARE